LRLSDGQRIDKDEDIGLGMFGECRATRFLPKNRHRTSLKQFKIQNISYFCFSIGGVTAGDL